MEIKTLNAGKYLFNTSLPQDCQTAYYDLPKLIGSMKQSHSWAKGELKNLILLNSPGKQVLLTAMHERTEVDYFQTNDSVSFQIIEGELIFNTKGDSLILKKGQLLTLEKKVEYSLTTNAVTVFLLTILSDNSILA